MTRVLLVDDTQDNLYYLSALLQSHGFEVDSARDGAEALSKARKLPPDVVVSDLLMPVMDGYTLLRHWKHDQRLKTAPFVVYTATYTDPEDEQLALDLGADAFILKPTEPRDFLTNIRRVVTLRAAPPPPSSLPPARDERVLLEEYSATLVRKLERKLLQLEATNRALREDIVARERAEAARDEAQRQASERAALLDALFASAPDAVVQLDLHGTIREANRSCGLLGTEHPIGASWLTVGPPEHRAIMSESFRSVIASGRPSSSELSVTTDGGSATYWVTIAAVVRDGRTMGAVAVVRDVTERKNIEAQLMVADRLASVGNLAASIAHEINNPLMCVTANLPMIEDTMLRLATEQPVAPEVFDALRDAREGAERVCVIARDLRLFARGDEERRGPVDVEQVLDSTLRMARNELRHRARLVKRYGHVPRVDSNESRLGQVFLNLIVNAVHAIPEGDYEHQELRIETQFDTFTRRVNVSVSDTGTGIPPEIQARIFKPFVTTKPVGVGTGLGLSICHRILTALGASIDFTSAVGRGTTFRVSLPTASELGGTVAYGEEAPSDSGVRLSGRVLLVDDDEPLTQVVSRGLAPDHDVQVVHSVGDALRLFQAGQRYDVILCDLMLPRATGMDLYRDLYKLDRRQAGKVVFMTGAAVLPKARAFLDRVENQRLEKPFELTRLRALVHDKLVRER
ncbi:MAG TPA: response regulator [Polyangiales bacterium]|nr:response regulator [Polyangiales bacterium]